MKLLIPLFITVILSFGFLLNNESNNTATIEGKPALAKALTKLMGVKVSAENVRTYNTRQIYQWHGVPDFLAKELGQKYKRFAYARYNKKIKGVHNIVFSVPNKLREKFNIDFVVAESQTGRPDGAGPEFNECTMKWCDINSNCVSVTVWSDGNCVDLCNSSGDCPQMEQCNKRMCMGSSCQTSVYYSAECDNTPACNSNEDCGGQDGKKTCYQKQCQGSECISIAVEVDQNAPCPNHNCQSDTDCNLLGGMGGPIIETAGY